MPYPWSWLEEEHDDLRESLRGAETYYSTEVVEAVKVLGRGRCADLVASLPGHWWTASCRAIAYNNVRVRPSPKHRRVPDIDCTCGFYAFKEAEMTDSDRAWGEYEWRVGNLEGLRAGLWRVELAGLVIEHERGYRAERLRLVSRIEPRDPVEVLHELGQGTTGQIRKACGFYSGNQSVHVRTALKAAARRGEGVEVKTPKPNNHGGHLWVSIRAAT